MSCISNNFSSFFLDSLNDPSEFAKYLGNAPEIKTQSAAEDIYGGSSSSMLGTPSSNSSNGSYQHVNGGGGGGSAYYSSSSGYSSASSTGCDVELVTTVFGTNQQHETLQQQTNAGGNRSTYSAQQATGQQQQQHHNGHYNNSTVGSSTNHTLPPGHFVNDFSRYLTTSSSSSSSAKNSTDYGSGSNNNNNNNNDNTTPLTNNLIDLDCAPQASGSSTTLSSSSSLSAAATAGDSSSRSQHSSSAMDLDLYDQDDSKHHLFDVHNSNESGGLAAANGSLLLDPQKNNSSNASDYSDSSNQTNASKPLVKFVIKENFDAHPAHKVEEGIFQHMNKLPVKKKDTLKNLGVTFTGHMTVHEKSIIVDNFAKFCEDYGIKDHRPFLSLNQCGMPKPEQIKFARYLGQGLPNFTLFCIYSNFKNLFCTKRFENYAKGTYNLHYILDKTKRFLTCTTADLRNLPQQPGGEPEEPITVNTNGGGTISIEQKPKILEALTIYENFEVHESHRIEDGIYTHIGRLSPKKQDLLKQFGIQSNHNVTLQEKFTMIENFMKFCKEYHIADHRPFLDFHDSGLPKMEQIKFVRYLGQGLPSLTLYKIYSAFKDVLALNRIEKLITDGYNLETILKKKRKNLLNRINAAGKASKDTTKEKDDNGKTQTVTQVQQQTAAIGASLPTSIKNAVSVISSHQIQQQQPPQQPQIQPQQPAIHQYSSQQPQFHTQQQQYMTQQQQQPNITTIHQQQQTQHYTIQQEYQHQQSQIHLHQPQQQINQTTTVTAQQHQQYYTTSSAVTHSTANNHLKDTNVVAS